MNFINTHTSFFIKFDIMLEICKLLSCNSSNLSLLIYPKSRAKYSIERTSPQDPFEPAYRRTSFINFMGFINLINLSNLFHYTLFYPQTQHFSEQ